MSSWPAAAPGVDPPRQIPDDDATFHAGAAAVAATGHGDDGAEVAHWPAVDTRRVDGDPCHRMPDPQLRVVGHASGAVSEHPDPDETDVADVVDDAEGVRAYAPVPATDPASALASTATGVGDVPPSNTGEAVAWWRARHPDMPVREICAKVGRSERTVRRILDGLRPTDQRTDAGPTDVSGHRSGVNGAAVPTLADSITSP